MIENLIVNNNHMSMCKVIFENIWNVEGTRMIHKIFLLTLLVFASQQMTAQFLNQTPNGIESKIPLNVATEIAYSMMFDMGYSKVESKNDYVLYTSFNNDTLVYITSKEYMVSTITTLVRYETGRLAMDAQNDIDSTLQQLCGEPDPKLHLYRLKYEDYTYSMRSFLVTMNSKRYTGITLTSTRNR
jgi:hypothetical protein